MQQFVQQEIDGFLTGFHRDRQQDQPRHIEVFAEKNTLYRMLQRSCSSYYVPFSIGRGFCSIPVWRDMARRFRQSGKDEMTLIVVSDYDPEGLSLADDAIRSLKLHGIRADGHRIAGATVSIAASTTASAKRIALLDLDKFRFRFAKVKVSRTAAIGVNSLTACRYSFRNLPSSTSGTLIVGASS